VGPAILKKTVVVPVDKPAIIAVPEAAVIAVSEAAVITIAEVAAVVPIATVAIKMPVTVVPSTVSPVVIVRLSRGQRGATRHQCRSYQQHS